MAAALFRSISARQKHHYSPSVNTPRALVRGALDRKLQARWARWSEPARGPTKTGNTTTGVGGGWFVMITGDRDEGSWFRLGLLDF
jgi:hypothetical protein